MSRLFSCFCNPWRAVPQVEAPVSEEEQRNQTEEAPPNTLPKPKNQKGWSAFENVLLLDTHESKEGQKVLVTMDADGIKVRDPNTEEVIYAYAITRIKTFQVHRGTTFDVTYVYPANKKQVLLIFKSDECISMYRTFAKCIEERVAATKQQKAIEG